jgi:hypothetical protein
MSIDFSGIWFSPIFNRPSDNCILNVMVVLLLALIRRGSRSPRHDLMDAGCCYIMMVVAYVCPCKPKLLYMLSHQIKYSRKPSTPISLQMCRNFDIVAGVTLIDNPMWIHLCMYTTSLICPQKLKCSPLKSHQTGYHDHDMNWCYVLVVR